LKANACSARKFLSEAGDCCVGSNARSAYDITNVVDAIGYGCDDQLGSLSGKRGRSHGLRGVDRVDANPIAVRRDCC